MRKADYNPFDCLTRDILEICDKSGHHYWVVQRFNWPGLPLNTAFICSAYDDAALAEQHIRALGPKEGKVLDIRHDLEKILTLLKKESGYHIFTNTLKMGWQAKLQQAYKTKFIEFIKHNTALTSTGRIVVDINLYLDYGRVMVELATDKKTETHPISEIFK